MKDIKAVALTPENFKDYGQILSISNKEPMADNQEIAYWVRSLNWQ